MQENSKAAARTLEDIEPEKLAGFFNDSPNEWLLGGHSAYESPMDVRGV